MNPETCHLDLLGPFVLESGVSLPRLRVAYRTWALGRLVAEFRASVKGGVACAPSAAPR